MAERIRGPRAVVGIRRRAVETYTAVWERQYRHYFSGMGRRYMASHPSGKSWDAGVFHVKQSGFWGGEEKILRQMLNQQYADMTKTVWSDVVSAQVGTKLDFDLNARGVQAVMGQVATRVTQINEASQRMIADRVQSEIERGSNADVLEKSVRDLLQSWGETGGRAHIISLTESGNAYNLAATNGYRESGLVEQVQVYDGPDCGWTEHDDPDLADGSVRTLEEADLYPLSHPHCQRAFGPVVLTEEEAQAAGLDPGSAVEEPPVEEPPEPDPEMRPLTFGSQYDWDEYAQKTFGDWAVNTPREAQDAIETYTGGPYAEINGVLRGTFDPAYSRQFSDDALQEITRNMDRAMVALPDTLQVSRSVYPDAFKSVLEEAGLDLPIIRERLEKLADLLPGRVMEDKGYFSTSMAKDPVMGHNIRMKIIVPKGTRAAPAYQVSAFDYEKELLLHRGVRYVVTKAEYDGHNFLDLEVTVLP